MTTWRWTTLLVLVTWTATCGQKGPLQLPERTNSTDITTVFFISTTASIQTVQ
ncbi:MAG: lipoprotein [Pseudomonadaceae bacterium]|nr:lipoprotein [Pseudomonadaceae bacterium]